MGEEGARLERELAEASRRYHETGDSALTDDEYDAGLERLRRLRPASPVLKGVGHAVEGAGAVDLPRRMGSLEKKRTGAQLRRAVESAGASDFLLSDKLDGQSALLHLPAGGGARMYSRGDGRRGRDLTAIVHAVDGVPRPAAAELRRRGIEFVRGELVVPRAAMAGLEGSRLRGFVTGVVSRGMTAGRDLAKVRFVAYEACGGGGACEAPSRQLAALRGVLPYVVHHGVVPAEQLGEAAMAATLISRKAGSEYALDGVVVAADEPYRHDEGADFPEKAFAFKSPLAESAAAATVTGVEWRVTRHGRLAPTLVVSPVTVNGSRVTRASGKSARHVVSSGLGVGAEVELAMAGDVIPDVRTVKVPSPAVPEPPVPYRWDDGGVHYVAVSASPEAAAAGLEHLFGALPVRGFGRAAAERLAAAGLTDAASVLRALPEELDRVLGGSRGRALLKALRSGIRAASRAALADALGVFPEGVGPKGISLALASGRSSAASLREVDGIGPAAASKLEEGLGRLREAEKKLVRLGVREAQAKSKAKAKAKTEARADSRAGPAVVFTGLRDRELEAEVEAGGGSVQAAVSASTDYLVTRDGRAPGTGKGRLAAELGVPVVSPERLRRLLA